VIPRCRSPFYSILLRILYPHYIGDPGKIQVLELYPYISPSQYGITITLPSFNCIVRTTIITSPVWFKTLSFTYFYDYLQAYRFSTNSTDDTNLVFFSLLLYSLTKLQALRFKLQLRRSYDSNDVSVWFKTLSFTYFYDYLQAYRIFR
jgi:hypothetical protein